MGPAQDPPWEFRGTSRFELRRTLGRGGMGVVYEVHDRERRMDVALKTLLGLQPDAIYRFKHEFRALADVAHPNLVSLYELVSEDDRWFFTMELLDGVDFLTYVRGGVDHRRHAEGSGEDESEPEPSDAETAVTLATPSRAARRPRREFRPAPPADHAKLREALHQLAEGLCALHASGHLHRDIKPSNVLVSKGRVVVVDFGVITELGAPPARGDIVEISGTPAYMAPEQASGQVATPASDWYSVGVMLYEALAGVRPFTGRPEQVMRAKQSSIPPPPRVHRDVPADLEALCMELLDLRPDYRPIGRDVLERLHVRRPARTATEDAPSDDPRDELALFGRAPHIAALRDAFSDTRRGAGATVYVHGTSGMGKTEVVRRFLEDIARDSGAVILAGRCYERESVPYKAVDSLVDALSQYLASLPPEEVAAQLPRDARLLVKVFPVLGRIDAVARARTPAGDGAQDPHELRRRAVAALRELCGRLARSRPLILFIDDLQWGDLESLPLLDALVRPPDAPPLLLIATYRTDDAERSKLLAAMLRRETERGGAANVRRISVEALPGAEASAMASALLRASPKLASDPRALDAAARAIADESSGHPYFIHELARSLRDDAGQRDSAGGARLTLDAVIGARVTELPAPAQRLLEVVAVSGRPTRQRVVQEAAGIDDNEFPRLIQQLRVSRLVRREGPGDDDPIEPYHDRIRETVVAQLAHDVLRAHHRSIAIAIERSDHPDAEALAAHFLEAAEHAKAARYAALAGEQAEAALSFERAATLYRLARDLGASTDHGAAADASLEVRLANALVNAGRGGEAAPIYLAAAARTTGVEALELRRRAAEQYLRSGHFDEGLAALAAVLDAVGLRLPRTPTRGVLSMLVRRVQLRLRGLGMPERDPATVSVEERMTADVCWSAAAGISQIDPARGAAFATRSVLLALRLGDARRAVRALTIEGCFVSSAGARGVRRTAAISARAEAIARASGDPALRAYVAGLAGFAAFQQGRFRDGYERAFEAEAQLREHCVGAAWEIGSMQLSFLSSLVLLGDLRTVAQLGPDRLNDAERRGDLYTTTNLRALIFPVLHMAADDPQAARRDASDAARQWSSTGFHNQHFMALIGATQSDLYVGDGRAALQRCLDSERALRQSLLLHVQVIRGYWLGMRAASAVAATTCGAPDGSRLLRIAERDARRLARERVPWCTALSTLVCAEVAGARREVELAARLLERAQQQFEAADMSLYATVARRRLGEMLGGEQGRALIEAADRWLLDQGVRQPRGAVAAFAPGFADR